MDLAYPLLSLTIVSLALAALGVFLVAGAQWVRWLTPRGPIALVTFALVAAAAVNVAVPRSCLDGERPDRQRPITAAIDSTGACERMGVGQLALLPLAATAGSLIAVARPAGSTRLGRERHVAASEA